MGLSLSNIRSNSLITLEHQHAVHLQQIMRAMFNLKDTNNELEFESCIDLTVVSLPGYRLTLDQLNEFELFAKQGDTSNINTDMRYLNLAYNQLGNKASCTVINCLSTLSSIGLCLSYLNLSGNLLEDSIASHMLDYMSKYSLTTLILYNNMFTDAFIVLLSNYLANDHAEQPVRYVDVKYNCTSVKELMLIDHTLDYNYNLHYYAMSDRCKTNVDVTLHQEINKLIVSIEAKLARNRELYKEEHQVDVVKDMYEIGLAGKECIVTEVKSNSPQCSDMDSHESSRDSNLLELKNKVVDSKTILTSITLKDLTQWKQWRHKRPFRSGFTVINYSKDSVKVDGYKKRHLKPCWCDPKDTQSIYANKLHYHCKYEYVNTNMSQIEAKGIENLYYKGCCRTGHTCKSIGYNHTQPVNYKTSKDFFRARQSTSVNNYE